MFDKRDSFDGAWLVRLSSIFAYLDDGRFLLVDYQVLHLAGRIECLDVDVELELAVTNAYTVS